MNVLSILLIVVILVLIYVVIQYLTKDISMLQQNVMDGTIMTTLQPSSLGTTNNSGNFSYSIWFYVNDWNYKYGELKFIFARMGTSTKSLSSSTKSTADLSALLPCPAVTLGPLKNNLTISTTCYSGDLKNPSDHIVSNTEIENVPIQRWVNLLFSVYGRTLDVYLDGKLVRTAILPGIANVSQTAPTYITPMGGFYGWTSKFQYWSAAMDPQQAWNVYKAGYGGSIFASLFGQYQVKVSLLNNGQETSSIQV